MDEYLIVRSKGKPPSCVVLVNNYSTTMHWCGHQKAFDLVFPVCMIHRLISPYVQMDDSHCSANPSQTFSGLFYSWSGHKVYSLHHCLAFDEYQQQRHFRLNVVYTLNNFHSTLYSMTKSNQRKFATISSRTSRISIYLVNSFTKQWRLNVNLGQSKK